MGDANSGGDRLAAFLEGKSLSPRVYSVLVVTSRNAIKFIAGSAGWPPLLQVQGVR